MQRFGICGVLHEVAHGVHVRCTQTGDFVAETDAYRADGSSFALAAQHVSGALRLGSPARVPGGKGRSRAQQDGSVLEVLH